MQCDLCRHPEASWGHGGGLLAVRQGVHRSDRTGPAGGFILGAVYPAGEITWSGSFAGCVFLPVAGAVAAKRPSIVSAGSSIGSCGDRDMKVISKRNLAAYPRPLQGGVGFLASRSTTHTGGEVPSGTRQGQRRQRSPVPGHSARVRRPVKNIRGTLDGVGPGVPRHRPSVQADGLRRLSASGQPWICQFHLAGDATNGRRA